MKTENKPSHTPWPWKMTWGAGRGQYPDGSPRESIVYRVGAAPDKPEIYREDLRDNALTVAECGENEANARLIAAAPDLLAACHVALATLDLKSMGRAKWTGGDQKSYDLLNAAILRATEGK